jgi:hypothetical protein
MPAGEPAVSTLAVATLEDLEALIGDVRPGQRLLAKTKIGPPPEHAPDMGPCMLWDGRTAGGYGRFRDADQAEVYVHVWTWRHLHGPVPPGYEVDHNCHNAELCKRGKLCPHRPCFSPAHLQLLTRDANWAKSSSPASVNRRATHCRICNASLMPGSPFLYVYPDGKRRGCRRCHDRRDAEYRARKAAREAARLADAGQLTLI